MSFRDEKTLRRLYHQEGLSQSEVAEKLDCGVSTVSKWMRKLGVSVDGPAEYNCDYCETTFQRPESSLTGGKKFCSQECDGKFKAENIYGKSHPLYEGGKDTFTCDNCGDEYEQYSCHVRGEERFCSYDCRADSNRVEGLRYYGPNWQEVRNRAIEKCEGICNYDGCKREETQDGRSLHVHHLIPLREFDSYEEANKLSNLVALCAEHHVVVEYE